ncbi:MAG: GntR family transcriptional regulator [Nocardioidaceae bacterium]
MYDSLALEHSSTVDRAAEALRRALFAGDLAPGTPLREVALAESLGVARSTVREALGVLTAEGLVTRIPNRGVVVTDHDPAQVHDVVRARVVLETGGARCWPTADETAREAVRTAVAAYEQLAQERAGVRAISEAHLAFHVSLVALTGSERLVTMAQSLAAEIRLALAHVDRVRGNLPQQVESHRRVLALLEAGDTETVVAELERHLHDAQSSISQAVDR